MSIKKISRFMIVLVFAGFLTMYYYTDLKVGADVKIFLTISTFLFSIFTGFFISRQNKRYSDLRDQIAHFDGNMSAIYRTSGHLGAEVQKEIGKILEKHYKTILEKKEWDYCFTHKTATITSIHDIFEKRVGQNKLTSMPNHALNRMVASLRDVQLIRKTLIALHDERVPGFQWILLGLLTFVLLITLSTVNSSFLFMPALIKAIFASCVITVLFILYQLDDLTFFQGVVGERSAQDVVDIVNDKK